MLEKSGSEVAKKGRKNHRSSNTGEHILLTSTELFSRQGFAATTTRQLCAATGLSASSIYYHYGSKMGLYLSALKWASEGRVHQFEDILEQSVDPIESLRSLVDAFVSFCAEEPVLVKLIKREQLEENPDTVDALTKSPLARMAAIMLEIICKLPTKEDPSMVVASLMGLVVHRYEARMSWSRLEGFGGGVLDPKAVGEHVFNVLLKGILGEGG